MFEGISVLVAFVLGLLLRFGIPVGLTGFILFALKRLDESWQAEAEQARHAALSAVAASRPACWEVNRCDPDKRVQCFAYLHPDEPCWQHLRVQTGRLPERCLACEFFRSAPILRSQVSQA